jgi:hypothetical protein
MIPLLGRGGQHGDCEALAQAALTLDAARSQRGDRATAEGRAACAVIVALADWDLEPAREQVDAAAVAAAAADPSGLPPHPLIGFAQAQLARFGGDGERALELLAGYLGSADPWVGAAARLLSAETLHSLGRIEEATLGCDAALVAFREIEESWGTAMALMFRADLDKIAGDCRGAIAALEEAMLSGRRIGAPEYDMTWLYSELAWLQIRTGDYAAAHAALGLADQNARAGGDWGPNPRLIRAELAWLEGHPAEATRLCEGILHDEADGPVSSAPLRALAAARLGVLQLEAGDVARGTALLRDAPGIRAAATEQLGQAAFDAAYQRGLGLPYDEALGFAQASAPVPTER